MPALVPSTYPVYVGYPPKARGRRGDAGFESFRALSASPFPLAERLRRERILDPEDLYYIGFQLAEAAGEHRVVARELLEHLAGKYGRTKVGKAAKNKLHLLPS
jgi:hypothetical protein